MMKDGARRGLLPTAGISIVAALALVTIVFLIAQAATENLSVTPPGGDAVRDVGLGDALFFTVVGGIVGTALAWAMNRFLARPRMAFLVTCLVGLGLYGIVPFAAAEETATGVWLNLMHLAVAVPVVGGLAMYLPDASALARSTPRLSTIREAFACGESPQFTTGIETCELPPDWRRWRPCPSQ